MSLSPMVAEFAATYEHEHGHKPAELVLQIAEHILKVGAMLREQGRKDAQSAQKPHRVETFAELAQYAFHNRLGEETAQAIGDLWRDEYMEGYQIE